MEAQAVPQSEIFASTAQQISNYPASITAALAPTRSVAEFDVVPRPIEAIKSSEIVRLVVKLHINVGQAGSNSPSSPETKLKARSL